MPPWCEVDGSPVNPASGLLGRWPVLPRTYACGHQARLRVAQLAGFDSRRRVNDQDRGIARDWRSACDATAPPTRARRSRILRHMSSGTVRLCWWWPLSCGRADLCSRAALGRSAARQTGVLGRAFAKGLPCIDLDSTPIRVTGVPPRVLTGDRPTGQLHLGHLFGTLRTGSASRTQGVDLMVLVADYQTITDRDSPASLPERRRRARRRLPGRRDRPGARDDLRPLAGARAQPAAVAVPEPGHAARAAAQPHRQGGGAPSRDAALNGLMLTYPVHQAADILFCHASSCRSAADQLPHVEQTRTIARRFNRRYAPRRPVFPEPEALLGDAPCSSEPTDAR